MKKIFNWSAFFFVCVFSYSLKSGDIKPVYNASMELFIEVNGLPIDPNDLVVDSKKVIDGHVRVISSARNHLFRYAAMRRRKLIEGCCRSEGLRSKRDCDDVPDRVGAEEARELVSQLAIVNPKPAKQHARESLLLGAIERCFQWQSRVASDQEIVDRKNDGKPYPKGLDDYAGRTLNPGDWFVKTLQDPGLYQVWECSCGTRGEYQWTEVVGLFVEVKFVDGKVGSRFFNISFMLNQVTFFVITSYEDLVNHMVVCDKFDHEQLVLISEKVCFQERPFILMLNRGICTTANMQSMYPRGGSFGPNVPYYVMYRPDKNGEFDLGSGCEIGIRRIPGRRFSNGQLVSHDEPLVCGDIV